MILGEASESDSEDIDLESKDESIFIKRNSKHDETFSRSQLTSPEPQPKTTSWSKAGIGKLGSSLFASLSSAGNLAKIVASSSNNFLNPLGIPQLDPQQQQQLDVREQPETPKAQLPISSQPLPIDQLPLLHKTLYTKNQQFHACLTHLQRHPYEKASKDLHSISQRLVNAQKIIQELDHAANRFDSLTLEVAKDQISICK